MSVAPPAPPAAERLFGDRLALARAYADLLCTEGVLRGVIGPREQDRIWSRHLVNSAALGALVPEGAHVVDVGSGAGLPGIPLALARPDLRVTLVEPLARRVAFLEDVVATLGVEVEISRSRAQELDGMAADVVVARAVAPLGRLVEWSAPMLRPGGLLLALKGAAARAELDAAHADLARTGVTGAEIVVVQVPDDDDVTVIRCVAGSNRIASGGGSSKKRR